MDPIPVKLFLLGYPAGIREQAVRLRALLKLVVPDATERVRLGWRLIGYDIPMDRKTRYFAWIALEPKHVHLGFQYGLQRFDLTPRGGRLRGRRWRMVSPFDTITDEEHWSVVAHPRRTDH